jgi:hypothetical protein
MKMEAAFSSENVGEFLPVLGFKSQKITELFTVSAVRTSIASS